MSAPETQCAAHEARRGGRTQAKPQRTRGIVLRTVIDGEWPLPQLVMPDAAVVTVFAEFAMERAP